MSDEDVVPSEVVPDAAIKRKKKRFTNLEFIKLKTLYESGEYTVKQLGEMFDRSPAVIADKLRKNGIRKGTKAQELQALTEREMEKDMQKNANLKVQRASATKNESYEWARVICALTVDRLNTARKNGESMTVVKSDLAAYKIAQEILEKGQNQRFKALGLDKGDIVDEDDLPDLQILEMNEQERVEVIEEAESKLSIVANENYEPDIQTKQEQYDQEELITRNVKDALHMMEDEELDSYLESDD